VQCHKKYYFTLLSDKKIGKKRATSTLANHSIKIYDLEKSVCDAVRFRNRIGLDITIEVVKNYVGRKDRDLNKLINYARQLRIESIMQNMIMPML